VPYLEDDVCQTPKWKLFKRMVDAYAQWKIQAEEARGYPSDDDYEFEGEDEINELEGQGLPRNKGLS